MLFFLSIDKKGHVIMKNESASDKIKKWRKNLKKKIIEAMGGCCQCCGYNRCPDALALHHLDPEEKNISLGGIRASPRKWKEVVEELKKCILVCHNCHSEIHAGYRKIPENFSKFDEKFEDFSKISLYDKCPRCGKRKLVNRKFCSHECSQKNKYKVNWDEIDLLDLMKKHSISELEKMLGVSNAAIYKRKKKILGKQKTKK